MSRADVRMNGSGVWAALLTLLALPPLLVGCSTNPAAAPSDVAAAPQAAAPAALQAYTQEIPGAAVELKMVPVPGDPSRGIEPFWMSATELTWDAYDIFVYGLDNSDDEAADAVARPSKPYISMDRGFGHAGYPAISVSLHGAQQFCAWLSEETGRHYRLPTVAEWRWACAQNRTEAPVDDVAWHKDNAEYKTHPVGEKAAGALGLFDLLGNAGEWAVIVDDDAAAAVNGAGDGAPRGLLLGGTYREPAGEISCKAGLEPTPDWNASDPQLPRSIWWLADAPFVGFRLICEPDGD